MRRRPLRLFEPDVGSDELAAVAEVLRSGHLTEGPVTARFETEVARLLGAPHGIAVTSCSTGLETSMRVLGVGPGDEVVVPDFTFPITADCVRLVGATPVLVDVDPETYVARPDVVERSITPRTKAVIAVSLFGHPIDGAGFRAVADRHDVAFVEDAACALGATQGGVPAGHDADLAVFSFHPRKVLTTGEGGMIVTSDDALAARCRRFKQFGSTRAGQRSTFHEMGTNYKMSDILAAIGLVQIGKLERLLARYAGLAATYHRLLRAVQDVVPPAAADGARPNHQTYAVRLPPGRRDRVLEAMRKRDIECQIGTYSLSRQPGFAGVRASGPLSVSHMLYDDLLSLPMMGSMTGSEQAEVVEALRDELSPV
ncbi:MAG: DegT/DnrJ/EryC1/StrS family aminotransferase [Methanobacteriota archaeon]